MGEYGRKNIPSTHGTEEKYLFSPMDVCRFMLGKGIRIQESPFEKIYLICLDSGNKLIRCVQLSTGTQTCVSASTYDAVKATVLCNCSMVILVHNHPGCSPAPSLSDIKFTCAFAKAFRCCGITLVDHVIIGHKKCCSMVRFLHPRLNFLPLLQLKGLLCIFLCMMEKCNRCHRKNNGAVPTSASLNQCKGWRHSQPISILRN